MTYVAFIAPPASSGGTVTTGFVNGNSAQNFTQSGVLDKFDSALGTLVSATLRLTLHHSMTGTVTLLPGASPPYDVLLVSTCSIDATSSLSALNSKLTATSPEIDDWVATPVFSIDYGSSPHAFDTVSSTATVDINLNSILGALTGSGTFTVSAHSFASLLAGGGDGYISASATQIGGFDALLTYTYT